jgi:uridine phosphorylase
MKPHIRLSPNPEFARVLVCGSPERAAAIASFLDGAEPLAKNREYHSFLGAWQGQKILITSHGVGSAGAAICFQELIDVGAKAIVRVGTAGGLYAGTRISDIVVPSAAIRRDGVSSAMVPPEYPAVPDLDLTSELSQNFAKAGASIRRGVILTSDLYYPGLLANELEFYQKANAFAVEMECSTLFVIGQLRSIKTAAALVLDGNPLRWNEGEFDNDPKRLQNSIEICAKAALSTLAGTAL